MNSRIGRCIAVTVAGVALAVFTLAAESTVSSPETRGVVTTQRIITPGGVVIPEGTELLFTPEPGEVGCLRLSFEVAQATLEQNFKPVEHRDFKVLVYALE